MLIQREETMSEQAGDFSAIRGGAFEAALRKRLGVGEDFRVYVEPSGGGDYQLGDYTWDTEPYTFTVKADPHRWVEAPSSNRSVLMGDVERWSERKEVEFPDIPAIWTWLMGEEGGPAPEAPDQSP